MDTDKTAYKRDNSAAPVGESSRHPETQSDWDAARAARRNRQLKTIKPVCATLEDEPVTIPRGALVKLNPTLLK
ncbi:MAG: hypothetical protein KGL39_19575 [Patescibacteria group bacterium]|nr:hypothetical protein [Patescibacteria group bacterium]